MEEVVPAIQRVPGMRSAKVYSGAGGPRADIRHVFEMDDAGVYERLLAPPATRRQNLCCLGYVYSHPDVFAGSDPGAHPGTQ